MCWGGWRIFQQPSQLFQDLIRISKPKHWSAFCRRPPNPCRRKLCFSLFSAVTTSVVGTCELGERRLSNKDMRVTQWLHWLAFDLPQPNTSWHEKNTLQKKCCWLLTGMPVCSLWVEFEPCIDYPNPAEHCLCLLRFTFSSSVSTFTQKHKQQSCFSLRKGQPTQEYTHANLHFLWNILTNSLQCFLAQWEAKKNQKVHCDNTSQGGIRSTLTCSAWCIL